MTQDTIYKLSFKDQQEVYEELLDLSNLSQDKDTPLKGAQDESLIDPLTRRDFDQYEQICGDRFQIKTENTETQTKVFVKNEDLIKIFFGELIKRDTDQDGIIDTEHLGSDLFINTKLFLTDAEIASRIQQVTQQYKNSVFEVYPVYDGPEPTIDVGTGFIIHRSEKDDETGLYTYHLMTNSHVADSQFFNESSYRLVSLNDNYEFEDAKRLSTDPLSDAALIEFKTSVELPVCPLSETDDHSLQEPVIEIGNRRGRGVIPLDGNITDLDYGISQYSYPYGSYFSDNYSFQTIRIHAKTRSGNSGSPVFNLDGSVIGLLFSGTEADDDYNIVPATRVQKVYENMLAHIDQGGVVYGDLGIYATYLREENRDRLMTEELAEYGVRVSRVFEDSLAADVLLPGDIIIGLNGDRSVTEVPDDSHMYKFLTAVLDLEPGADTRVELYRPGEGRITVTVTAGERLYKSEKTFETNYGFNVMDIPQELRQLDHIPEETQGVWVYIRSRDKNDTATGPVLGNLADTNIITHVNNTPTPDVETFKKEFEKACKGDAPVVLKTITSSRSYTSNQGGVGEVDYVIFEP